MASNSNNPPSTRTSPDSSIDDLKAHDAAHPPPAPRPSAAILKRPAVNPSGTKSSSAAPSSHSSRASSPSSTSLPLRASAPTSPSNAPSSARPSLHMTPFSSTQTSPTATKSPPPEQQQAESDRTPRASNASSSSVKPDETSHQQVHSPGLRSPVLGSRRNSGNSMKLSDVESSDPNLNSLTARLLSFGGSAENSGSDEPASRKAAGHGANAAGKIPRGASGMAPRLETVQEGDQSTPPRDAPLSAAVKSDAPQISSTTDKSQERTSNETSTLESSATKVTEDNSKRAEGQAAQESTKNGPRIPLRKASTSSLPQLKNRQQQPNEGGSAKTMTVETETVTSIPQAPTATADRSVIGRADTGGALRTKNSSDTIRPKKERKKPNRKPQLSGTGNTKADLFEAKVASAVDQGESDSDETFVYESNPLEPRHRNHTHHSRTPSTNSVRSFADRRAGVRSMSQLEPQRAVTGKRSMKFASSASYASSSMDEDDGEREGGGAARSQHTNGHARRHHTYRSFMDPDSPFSNASRMNARDSEPKTSSRRGSPHSTTPTGPRTPTRKNESTDFEGDRADDESAPLLGTVRQKPRYQPKRYTQLRHMDVYLADSPKRSCSRCICCTIAILFGIVVVLAIVGFAILTTKPLHGVHITEIRNVLASEQEIMFDVVVKGVNPNMVTITAANVDINIFARSKYVGSDKFWRDHGFPDPPENGGSSSPSKNKTSKAVAVRRRRRSPMGLFPIERPEPHEDKGSEKATMLLGRVFEFDSGVEFTASPWQHKPSVSVGEMRLAKPGNKTETGGTERWEAVLEHPFELIVRGIVYYQLPLTTSTLTASLGASVLVTPDSAGGRYTPITDNEGNVLLGDGDEGWWP